MASLYQMYLLPILQTLNILAIHHLHPHNHIHCTPILWMFLNLPIHHSSNSLTHFQDRKLIDCSWIVQKSETIIFMNFHYIHNLRFIRVTFLKFRMNCFDVGTRFHVLITKQEIYNVKRKIFSGTGIWTRDLWLYALTTEWHVKPKVTDSNPGIRETFSLRNCNETNSDICCILKMCIFNN
jgi:hypothetical protein